MTRKADQVRSAGASPAPCGAPTVEAAADITERSRAEMALADSERRFRLLAENSTDVLWVMGLDGRLTYVSPSVEKLRGYTVDEVMAQSMDQRLTPDGLSMFQKEMVAILDVIAGGQDLGEPRRFEVEQPRKGGSTVWTEVSIGIMRDQHGKLVGFRGVSRDISERKRAEMALADSERRFRLLVENSSDVVWAAGLDGRFIYVSPSVEKLRGYTVDEVMAQTMDQVLTPEGLSVFQEGMATIFEPVAPGEDVDKRRVLDLQQPCKDGSLVWTEVSVGIMRNESGEIVGIQGASRDITERKRAEAALLMSEERFSAAFRSSPDAFFLSSVPEGRIVESNTTASRLSGYGAEEMLGRTTTELGLWLDPAAREEYVARVQREGRVLDFETEFRTPSGIIHGLISGEIIQLKDGPYFLSIVRDISERKRAAEALMAQNRLLEEAQERLSGLVAEKDRFVGTVSHELRTPLAVVLGFAAELRDRAGVFSASQVAEFAGLISQSCATANNLVEDLLAAARVGVGSLPFAPEAIDVQGEVRAVAAEPETASRIGRKSLELAGLGTVAWADPQRVRQIIRNLLVNAGRYGGPHISVSSGASGNSPAVFCRVVDDGPGVPEYLLDRLFHPYQHGARDPGLTESVGLGLYLSRNLARLMGGDLTYHRDGAATVFELTLPVGRVAAAA